MLPQTISFDIKMIFFSINQALWKGDSEMTDNVVAFVAKTLNAWQEASTPERPLKVVVEASTFYESALGGKMRSRDAWRAKVSKTVRAQRKKK